MRHQRWTLASAVLASSMLVACGGLDLEADERVDTILTSMETSSVAAPAEFPHGIPTFPGLRAVSITETPMNSLQASSTDSVETITQHYKDAFEQAGWTYDEVHSKPDDNHYFYKSPTDMEIASFHVTLFERRGTSIPTLTILQTEQ